MIFPLYPLLSISLFHRSCWPEKKHTIWLCNINQQSNKPKFCQGNCDLFPFASEILTPWSFNISDLLIAKIFELDMADVKGFSQAAGGTLAGTLQNKTAGNTSESCFGVTVLVSLDSRIDGERQWTKILKFQQCQPWINESWSIRQGVQIYT